MRTSFAGAVSGLTASPPTWSASSMASPRTLPGRRGSRASVATRSPTSLTVSPPSVRSSWSTTRCSGRTTANNRSGCPSCWPPWRARWAKPGGGWGAGYATMDATGIAKGRPSVATIPGVSNPVPDFIPVARIADTLLHPGKTIDYDGKRLTLPELRLIYWCGGNPFHHHQDLHRLTRAWQTPDTVVIHEAWWNTTAKFADIVLPVATSLERDDFAAGFSDPHLVAMPKVREPHGRVADRPPHLHRLGLAARIRAGVHGVALRDRMGPTPLRADEGRTRRRCRLAGLRRLLAKLHR